MSGNVLGGSSSQNIVFVQPDYQTIAGTLKSDQAFISSIESFITTNKQLFTPAIDPNDIAAAVQNYISDNANQFRGNDAQPLDYSQLLADVESYLNTNKANFTPSIDSNILAGLVSSYIQSNVNQFKADALDYSTLLADVESYLITNKANFTPSIDNTIIAGAVSSYIQSNINQFKADPLDYSTLLADVESYLNTNKANFTPDVDNSILAGLVSSYIQANASQFRGADATPLNYPQLFQDIKDWMTANNNLFRGDTVAYTPNIDYAQLAGAIDVNNLTGLSSLIASNVDSYLVAHPVSTLSSSDVNTLISDYLVAHPVSTLTTNDVNSIISSYLTANPVSTLTTNDVNSIIASYLVANPVSTLSSSDVNTLIGNYMTAHPVSVSNTDIASAVSSYLTANPPSGGGGASLTDIMNYLSARGLVRSYYPNFYFNNLAYMYKTVSPNNYGTTWKVEAIIKFVSAYQTDWHCTILDLRNINAASSGATFGIGKDGGLNQLFYYDPSVGGDKYTTATVKVNDWSHVVWQCSPSTGLQMLVDGVLSYTNAGYTYPLSFSETVIVGADGQRIRTSYPLPCVFNGYIFQLIVRAGSGVNMYSNGYTVPTDLTDVIVNNSSDIKFNIADGGLSSYTNNGVSYIA